VVTGHETGENEVDGVLVAAQLARLGLAVVDPAGATQDSEYQAIAAAPDAARAAQTGLYSPTTACTLPAQLAALAAATAEASSESDAVIALAVLAQPHGRTTAHLDDAARSQKPSPPCSLAAPQPSHSPRSRARKSTRCGPPWPRRTPCCPTR
jgi:hypothetical protein